MYDLEEEQSNPKHRAAYEKIHAYEPMLAGSTAPPK